LRTAAGCQLVASCDLAVASEAAKLRHPRRRYRIVLLDADGGRCRATVPRKQAMEMLLTGEPITAATAAKHRPRQPRGAGRHRNAPAAIAWRKRSRSNRPTPSSSASKPFYRQAEMSLGDAYRFAAEVMTENMMARDAEEGIGAFIEKREPKWQDK